MSKFRSVILLAAHHALSHLASLLSELVSFCGAIGVHMGLCVCACMQVTVTSLVAACEKDSNKDEAVGGPKTEQLRG